jgi:hypothetical protein
MHPSPVLAIVLLAGTPIDQPLTFNKHIAPILWARCAGCHRPGEVGPFPLLSYHDAANRAGFLKEVVKSRKMPPWKPEPGYGRFADELRLSDAEVEQIVRWVDEGAEEGESEDLPPAPQFAEGWQLGEPDLVLEMPEPFDIPAGGDDIFRCFVIPTNLTNDRAVSAIEFRPGDRRVVHHALFFLDSRGQARAKDEADPGPGYASFGGAGIQPTGMLGGWAPGTGPRPLPEGVGRLLPRDSDLVLQIHYHPSGKPESDRSLVGIHFAKTPLSQTRILAAVVLSDRGFAIPPGASNHPVVPRPLTLPTPVTLVGITPHMHWIGREMKVRAVKPDGTEVPLIWIKQWDFNWQGQYLFAEPIPLPGGTRIELEAYYDNSESNPRSVSQVVTHGEGTTDEMCLCGIQVLPDTREGYALLRQSIARYFLASLRVRDLQRLRQGRQ